MKFFNRVNSIEQIQKMKLPIAKISTLNQTETDVTLDDIDILPPKQQTCCIEFDLSSIKKLMDSLQLSKSKIDCFPLLWI